MNTVSRHSRKGNGARIDTFRFLIAGGCASAVNWLVRFPLSTVIPFVAAVALAYIIGMIVGFVLYRGWVFPGSELSLRDQIVRFIAVNLLGFLTVVSVSWMATGASLGIGLGSISGFDAVVHAGAIGLGAVVNFFGHRGFSFARYRR